jgi:V/A-type H+-transporting ATPase subunit K
MKRNLLQLMGVSGLGMCVFAVVMAVALQSAVAEEPAQPESAGAIKVQSPWLGPALVLGSAVAISTSCLGAGYAVGKVGAAAMGAVSERPELVTRALLFVALAEGIAIYGLVVAVMLLLRI